MTSYEPEADGQPDPGEVVLGWVPFEEDPSQGKDRPVLLIGRKQVDGLDYWAGLSEQPERYEPGSWGPAGADAMLARDGFAWRRP